MSTMLPFTTMDLVFAVVAISFLLLLSLVVYGLARLQQPARPRLAVVAAEPEAELAASGAPPASQGAIQAA